MRLFDALCQRVDQGDLGALAVLLLVALVVFVLEIGWFCAVIAWMESRRDMFSLSGPAGTKPEMPERALSLQAPVTKPGDGGTSTQPDAISINAARHRRLLDLEGL